jgi:hypothetical protein
MAQELSVLAQRYLRTKKRRRHIQDLDLVRAALAEAGVPVTEPVLDFHCVFAGYPTDISGEDGALGIIHRRPVSEAGWFAPMKVYVLNEGDRPPRTLACADVHISWEMFIDLEGTIYCNGPTASSYFLWTEQCAVIWDFVKQSGGRRLWPDENAGNLNETLVPRVAAAKVEELSDQYTALPRRGFRRHSQRPRYGSQRVGR